MNTAQTTCDTILTALGGAGRLMAMLGAKTIVDTGSGLQFKFAAAATNKANMARFMRADDGSYLVVFYRVRGIDWKRLGMSIAGPRVEDLRAAFVSATGLELSL